MGTKATAANATAGGDAYRFDILEGIRQNVLADRDIMTVADALADGFDGLLAACRIKPVVGSTQAERDYTRVLVDHFVLYKAGVDLRMGGSRCDYASAAATKATAGYVLRLDGTDMAKGILNEIRSNIKQLEWEPDLALRAEERVGLV